MSDAKNKNKKQYVSNSTLLLCYHYINSIFKIQESNTQLKLIWNNLHLIKEDGWSILFWKIYKIKEISIAIA